MTTVMAGEAASLQTPGTCPRPPNRVAREITGRTYLSHSQLACMRACPRQFAFKYSEKAPADFVPSGLLFGACIHVAIEHHFLALQDGRNPTHEMLLAAFDDAWRHQQSTSEPAVPVRFNKDETADTLHALADRMLAAFLAAPVSQPDGQVAGVEEEVRIVLDSDLPDLLMRIDLVTQSNSGLCITDFKTSRSRWTQDKALEASEQLLLYAAAVRQTSCAPDLSVNLQFAVLTKAKNPIVQLLPVPFDANRVAMLRDNVAAVWQAIQGGHFYPNPSPMNCSTCPYRSRCPLFGNKWTPCVTDIIAR